MYNLQLIGEPNGVAFSRNPIVFRFRVSPFTANELNNRLRVVVNVYMESNCYSNVYTLLWSGAEYPDGKGYAKIDLQTILDANLEFHIPDLTNPSFQRCKNQSKRYYISYQLQNNDGFIGTPVSTITYIAAKGGLSREENNQSVWWNTIVFAGKTPLHFYSDNQLIRTSEYRWMYFMLAAPNDSLMRFYVSTVYDNTLGPAYYLGQQYIAGQRGEIFCVAFNLTYILQGSFTQAVRAFTMRIHDATTNITRFVGWNLDYRNIYEETQLFFRNSAGGLDTQSFVGEKEMGLEIAKSNAELVTRSELIGLFRLQDEKPMIYSSQRPRYKLNTGWISRKQLDTLRDLMLRKEVFTPYGIRIVPVEIMTDSFRLWKTSDKLYALELEYSPAFDDVNYTPEQTIPLLPTCPALLYFGATQEKARFVHIVWSLPPGYDTVRVRVYIGASLFVELFFQGTDGEADIQIQATAVPLTITPITLQANVQCSPTSFGPTSNASASISSILAPIAIDDVADISTRNTAARILQRNATPLYVIANDIAKNGQALSFFGFFTAGGAATTTSQNGANLAISPIPGGGLGVSYTPTGGSIGNTLEDAFYYKCAENVPGFGWISSNLAKVRVPLTDGRPRVYVKAEVRVVEETSETYGFLGLYKEYDTLCDVYIAFFLDAACTVPVDVTNFGYTIGYKKVNTYIVFNNFGGVASSGSNPDTTHTQAITGTSMIMLFSEPYSDFNSGTNTKNSRSIVSNPAGNIGDIVFVGW